MPPKLHFYYPSYHTSAFRLEAHEIHPGWCLMGFPLNGERLGRKFTGLFHHRHACGIDDAQTPAEPDVCAHLDGGSLAERIGGLLQGKFNTLDLAYRNEVEIYTTLCFTRFHVTCAAPANTAAMNTKRDTILTLSGK